MAFEVTNELISRCKSKDRIAQKKLYGKLVPYLNAVCKRYLRNKTYINDVLQEIFILIFTKIDTYNSTKGSFKTWSVKITINCCLKHNQKNSKLVLQELELPKHEKVMSPKVFHKCTDEEIIEFLKTMPISYFETFNLFVIEGFSHKEIAQLLNIEETLSRKRLSRAKNWIEQRIESKQCQGWLDYTT